MIGELVNWFTQALGLQAVFDEVKQRSLYSCISSTKCLGAMTAKKTGAD
jgi:hypothetical protein